MGFMADSVLHTDEQLASIWSLGGLSWRELGRRVWGGINQNDLLNRGYELAYNFLFAVFPLLFFLFALLGIFASEGGRLRNDFFGYLHLLLPPAAYQILSRTIAEITANSVAGKLTFGLVLALYSASSGMTQLISTLNAAYEVREERSWLKVHGISLALTLAISVLAIGSLFLVLAGGQLINSVGLLVGSYGRSRRRQALAMDFGYGVRGVGVRPCLLLCSRR